MADEYPTHYEDEEVIIAEVSKYVDLVFFEFSGIEEVEYLQKYKHIEENTQMDTICGIPILYCQSNRTLNMEKVRPFKQYDR